MARKGRPSSSNWTSTESRVVPGRSETIIRSAWARVLMKVDLPVLGRPTTAIFMTASAGFSSSPAGQHLLDQLEQCLAIAILLGGDRNRLASTELVEFSAPLVDLGIVGLVHHQDDRRLEVTQPLGDLLVQGHQLVADVHDEEDQAGLVHGRVDLPVDVLAQIVAVDHADAAGVDQLEEPRILVVADLRQRPDPVAGDPGQVIDDGDPPPRQPVEQRRLADVRSAHDHDLGESHDSVTPQEESLGGAPPASGNGG